MRENPHLTELANATSTGLLAEEMVFVISDLLRERTRPGQEGLRIIGEGRDLLKSAVGSPAGDAISSLSKLSEPEGTLDTIRAVLVKDPKADVEGHVRRLDSALGEILEGDKDPMAHEAELMDIRELFATVGHLTLSRANRLTRSPQERLGWPTSAATSSS